MLKPEANLTAVSSPSQWHNILVAVEGMSTESSQESTFFSGDATTINITPYNLANKKKKERNVIMDTFPKNEIPWLSVPQNVLANPGVSQCLNNFFLCTALRYTFLSNEMTELCSSQCPSVLELIHFRTVSTAQEIVHYASCTNVHPPGMSLLLS